jgi:hypothetical protein
MGKRILGHPIHLSMKDVDDKDRVLHGFKSKEEILCPIMEIIKCPQCQRENAAIAMHCVKCGAVLSKQSTSEAIREEVREILKEKAPELLRDLSKEA